MRCSNNGHHYLGEDKQLRLIPDGKHNRSHAVDVPQDERYLDVNGEEVFAAILPEYVLPVDERSHDEPQHPPQHLSDLEH